MLKIILDSRERQLISLIKGRGLERYENLISFETSQLELGDIHICHENRLLIMERKTVADLLSSIKDGRYKEQKARLLASSHDITYIIEGDDINSSLNTHQQHILSSVYMHTLYRDNIKIVFTKDASHTTTFLLTLCTKIIDKPDMLSATVQGDYIDCVKIKSKKSQNITPSVCYMMQLGQIPTVSSKIARNIQSAYPTMRSLISALEASDDKAQLLCKIELVGKEKAKKIIEYLEY